MNTHLSSQIYNAGHTMFIDASKVHLDVCIKAFHASSQKQERVDFWANVQNFFDTNDVVKNKYKIQAPCHFIEDNPSAGRHRQHLYVNDKVGNSFQIYALSHKNEIAHIDDCFSIAAVAQGLMSNNVSGVYQWFADFRAFSLQCFKSSIKSTLETMDNYPHSNKDHVKTFLNKLFQSISFRPVTILDLQFDNMPDLSNLYAMSIERWKQEIDVNDFKAELTLILNQLP